MEKDGPNTPGGEEEAESAANVVHFPRDWFGPREELVPFGPRAAGELADEPSLSVPSPVRADDFWGEESASIHNAMAGPETDPVEVVEPVPVPAPAARRRRVRTRRPLVSRLRVRRPRVRLSWPRVRRRRVAIAAAVVSAGLLALSFIGSSWSGPVSVAHGGRDGATLSPAVIAPALPPITSARTEGRAASRRRPATHGRGSRQAHARARPGHARVSGSAGARGAGQAVVGSTSSAGSSTSTDQSSGTVGESSATSAGPASTSSGSGGGGGGGGGASGQASGPVGPGAPFGPGHLG